MLLNVGGGFWAFDFCDAQEQTSNMRQRPMAVAEILVMIRLLGRF
jgi:hypothetical protein